MKSHTNNYFIRTATKPISQISTNSVVTKSIEQKSPSYLIFTRGKHKRKNNTASKLPQLQSISTRAKTDIDQIDPPFQSELKKSVVIISRKPSATFISQRVKTQPSIQVWEPEAIKESAIPKYIDILCEELVVTTKTIEKESKKRILCKSSINELESFQDKSSKIVRKIIQLLQNHRERCDEKEIKSRTIIDTQMVKSLLYSTQTDPQSPFQKEPLFQNQLSAIPKKHTKINSQITLTHQAESFKPMKSLIEAIQEVQQETAKKSSVCATTPIFQTVSRQKLKIVIECIEESKVNKLEFNIPQYMDDETVTQVHQQTENLEAKTPKQSANIYSLVSKNMFNKKVNKIQNRSQQEISEFNFDRATQFTRYYLQNYQLKCINPTKILQVQSPDLISFIMKQESKCEQQLFTSRILQIDSTIMKDSCKYYLDIPSEIYRCPEPFDSQNTSMISDTSSENNSQIDVSFDHGMRLRYLQQVFLIDPTTFRERLIKFIISTISDESKNLLLHQEIVAFANQVEEVIHIDYEMPHQPHLEALNRLFLRTHKIDRRNFLKRFQKKYEIICTGLFENSFKHFVQAAEKQVIKYCFQQQSNSILEQSTLKGSNMLKSKHCRENTLETIPKQQNLMTLSLPPTTKSRSESPSNISEAKTQKNGSTLPQQALKNTMMRTQKVKQLQKQTSQYYLQVQGAAKTQNIKVNNNLSVVKEQIIVKNNEKQKLKMQPNYFKQQSMDPYSLLFRNMIIQQTLNEEKTLFEKIFMMVEEHRSLDLKEVLKNQNSFDLNHQNDQGNTLLISAAKCGACQIVEYLLQNGADVAIVNNNGQNAMDVALENYQFTSADIIIKYLKPENNKI